MRRSHTDVRIGSKYLSRIIFTVASLFFVVLVYISWNSIAAIPAQRTTAVVAAGDPIQILSWDDTRGKMTVIPIPADVYLDGAFGVGSLPLASLQKLETLDSKKKGVFVKSLENTFALPIVGVMSELSLPLRFRLWWILMRLRPDALMTVDLRSQGVFRSDVLADGSRVRVFDVNRFDAIMGNRLEVDAIRREELRLRVTNTTEVPGLGNRAARVLSHAGMVVVAVESEPPTQKRCTVHAKKKLWNSQTGRFIQRVFQCSMTDTDLDERFDVTVLLGTDYAQD